MKKMTFFLLVPILALLACISGYLMSKPSLVGRIGINLFYKEYRFLEKWWQGAALVFVVWMMLLFLQGWAQRKLSRRNAILLHCLMIVLALVGFYFTYSDFQHTTTHRWLRARFHIGAYLFWSGMVLISLFYIVQNNKDKKIYEEERGHIAVQES